MAHPRDTTADKIVVLKKVDWAELENVLERKGDRAVPRVAYLDGSLELMTPSRHHEHYNFNISRLFEQYLLELDIEFCGYGRWTLKNKRRKAVKEPDECYVFGPADLDDGRTRPDLAIEIVWTRGGLDKLEIYRRLRVPEVWIWRRDVISVYELVNSKYQQRERSQFAPALELDLLCRLSHSKTFNEAVAGLKRALKGR